MQYMSVAPKKLVVGELVEVDGRRYDVIADADGELTLEPEQVTTVVHLDRRHGGRAATQAEIEDQLDLLPADGEG